ncbi:hypothetical protein FLWE109334_14730 [Flavobacterium weaverense]|uniref:Uncharacterized protein n=2 Tax=Flavobacterium weaverense TaxID=271156 RepID=A0A3L9ZP01_9FLAO|nr:hypothetical protein BC961_2746 [Flavobacterium weaverense]
MLPFALVLGFLYPNQCIAKNNNGNSPSEIVNIDTTYYTVLHISPFLDSTETDSVVTENVKEEDSLGLIHLKSNFLLNANLSSSIFLDTLAARLDSKHFMLGNMIPVRNIPRYILFHNLQIHF